MIITLFNPTEVVGKMQFVVVNTLEIKNIENVVYFEFVSIFTD